jgi:6-deoxyerythronolide B hydroxylase
VDVLIQVDHSHVIPAGDSVMFHYAAANRDPRRFPEPDRFDIRRPENAHLAFSHGVHFCIGAPLARTEARIALTALLSTFPDLRLAVPAEQLQWRTSRMVRGLKSLPVRLDGGFCR